MYIFGLTITRTSRIELFEKERENRIQTIATLQTTNEGLRRGNDDAEESKKDLRAITDGQHKRITELTAINAANLTAMEGMTVAMAGLGTERDTARLVMDGQVEVIAELKGRIDELEADTGKNALRKDRDAARAQVKTLKADLKQAQKNDTPRHPETKKFISRAEAAELEAAEKK